MGTILILVIFSLMTCYGQPEDGILGPQLINGLGQKVWFHQNKPVLLAINKTVLAGSGEYNSIKNHTNEPQVINGQGHKVEFRGRKPVLITIPETIDAESGEYNITKANKHFLKSRSRKLPKVIYSLLYYETDRHGYEIYSVWLYSLRDVAKLFINRFDIDIEYE